MMAISIEHQRTSLLTFDNAVTARLRPQSASDRGVRGESHFLFAVVTGLLSFAI